MTITTKDYISLNPYMSISTFDDAGNTPKVLCEIPDTKGQTNRVTIPSDIFNLLQELGESRSLQDLKAQYLESDFKTVSWEKFEAFVNEYCLEEKVLVKSDETDHRAKPKTHKKIMQLQWPFMQPWLVNPISKIFMPFYHPLIMAPATILFVTLQILFYMKYEPYVTLSFEGLNVKDGFLTVGLLILGLLVHEFGHTTAAYKHGCRKVSIGVGWYLYFLVFYAELSESWRLPRKQRVLIDAGGLYFQAIYMTILVIIYTQTTSASIFYCLLFLSISFVWNLNPFLRMDGYWIASDILGISNLRAEATAELKYLAAKLIGRHIERNTSLNDKSRFYLGVYSMLSNAFFIWLSYILSERILYSIKTDLPQRVTQLTNSFIQGMGFLETSFSLFLLAFHLLILFFISRIVIRIFISMTSWVYPELIKTFRYLKSEK